MAQLGSDQLKHLLQPDAILPSQYLLGARRRIRQQPAVRLVEAILRDAVECFQKHLFANKPKHRDAFRDAERWICSTDRSWPFAFENVCEILGIEPNYLRQGLLNWKQRQLSLRIQQDLPIPTVSRNSPMGAKGRGCRRR